MQKKVNSGKSFLQETFSTPNMTGRRFHRITEVIPRRPWKSKSPFASRPIKISINKGTRGLHARYDRVLPPFIHIVGSPGRPVHFVVKPRPHCQIVSVRSSARAMIFLSLLLKESKESPLPKTRLTRKRAEYCFESTDSEKRTH